MIQSLGLKCFALFTLGGCRHVCFVFASSAETDSLSLLWPQTGKPTLQSDVYAFSVVLLELLTGRRAVDSNQGPDEQNLVLQVRHVLNDWKKLRNLIDPEMNRTSYTMKSMTMFASLASCCIYPNSGERSPMAECVEELQLILYTNSKGLNMALHRFGYQWHRPSSGGFPV
ncbi:probable serine/threonine-protein kinase PBL28 [Rhodamnia argentea]|uniref:Probable serine/threonine-protein kinase PBL28 n=1 Tax=Rhodamnia argentea TaxID=178133 RepID=A0ABM3HGY1_9MYRT|nr:probable serine/threonine-protein kinase PBL28 [Rhodamnia argentea]